MYDGMFNTVAKLYATLNCAQISWNVVWIYYIFNIIASVAWHRKVADEFEILAVIL